MEQIIKDHENEETVIDRIKGKYDIWVQRVESENCLIFADVQSDIFSYDKICSKLESGVTSVLKLIPRAVAMRKNPAVSGVKRAPCMADVERANAGLLCTISIREKACEEDSIRKLLSGALAYQNQMQIPLCFVEDFEGCAKNNTQKMTDFYRQFGFQYVYDRPRYTLNAQTVSLKLLERAAAGETVCLDVPNIVLRAVSQEETLSLAHFVNANLCKQYGLFMIRSAAYYERVLKKLQGSGGCLFQIMENGVRKGCFICMNSDTDNVREVVFEQAFDSKRYLLPKKEQKPTVMARIVNLPEMLRHISSNGKVTIAIRVNDSIVTENDGLFIWYIDESGSRMERVGQSKIDKDNDSSARPEVTTTIGEFTAFVCTYMKLKQNAKFDSIHLAGPAWIDEMY